MAICPFQLNHDPANFGQPRAHGALRSHGGVTMQNRDIGMISDPPSAISWKVSGCFGPVAEG
eukprot:scaffold54726_cov42-Cyclotella_meneghiniana.AAC.2